MVLGERLRSCRSWIKRCRRGLMENLGLDRERRWRWASAGAIMAHEPPGRKSAQSAQSLTPDQQKVQGGKGERNWKNKTTEGFVQCKTRKQMAIPATYSRSPGQAWP